MLEPTFNNKKEYRVILSILFFLLLLAKPAQAYIDPGSSSYLFQLLIAGLLSSLFFLKTIIKTINDFIRKLFLPKKFKDIIAESNKNE